MKSQIIFVSILSTLMFFGCSPSTMEGNYPSFKSYVEAGGKLSLLEWLEAGKPLPGKEGDKVSVSSLRRDHDKVFVTLSSGQTIELKGFECGKKCDVNFIYSGINVFKKTVLRGTKIEKPNFEAAISETWYTDEALTKPWNFSDFRVVESMNLYAKAPEKIEDRKPSWVSFIDTEFHINPLKRRFLVGEEYVLPNLVDRDSNKRFLGWKTPDGKLIENKGTWNIPNSVTLVSSWRDKRPFEEEHFGLCPQTVVTDPDLIEILEKKSFDTEKISGNSDYIEHDGEWYQKGNSIEHRESRGTFYFNDRKTIIKDALYYFKVEPIEWKLIDISKAKDPKKNIGKDIHDDEYLAISKKVILPLFINDGGLLNVKRTLKNNSNTEAAVNDYKYSYLRIFLNGLNGKEDFGDWAANCKGNSYGLTTEKMFLNEKERQVLRSYGDAYGDKLFVLSKEECENYLSEDELRAEYTDNFIAYCALGTLKNDVPYSPWWTRTAAGGDKNQFVTYVEHDGTFRSRYVGDFLGVRLAIKIKKSSVIKD